MMDGTQKDADMEEMPSPANARLNRGRGASSSTYSTLTPSEGGSPAPELKEEPTKAKNDQKMDEEDLVLKLDDAEEEKKKAASTSQDDGKGSSSDSDSGESPEAEEKIFEAEAIIARKKVGDQFLWRIRWFGYGPKDDTWEPTENLLGDNVRQMMAEFEKKEEEKKQQKKEMIRRSQEFKKQQKQQQKSEIPSSSAEAKESGDEDKEDLDGSNVEGWFGIKSGEESRERRGLFVPDRRLSKTEKLLTEISSPGVRVLRNQLRESGYQSEQQNLQSTSSGSVVNKTNRKRGRPRKIAQINKLEEQNDVFTSESSPARIEISEKKAKKRKVRKPKLDESTTLLKEVETKPEKKDEEEKKEEAKGEEEKQMQVDEKEGRGKEEGEEKTKHIEKEKPSRPKEEEEPSKKDDKVAGKEKGFGISKKLKQPKHGAFQGQGRMTVPKVPSFLKKKLDDKPGTSKDKPKLEKKKKQKETSTSQSAGGVELPLKVLAEGANISAELERILKKKNQAKKLDGQAISQQEFEEIVMDGKVEKVRDVLVLNAQEPFLNLDHTDDTGKTLIHKLCEIRCGVSHTQCELIDLLVSNGARLDIRESNHGQIPLHLAIANRRLCHVRKLLSLNTPVNIPDRLGKPPIMLALESSSDFDFLKFMLKAGASFHLALEKVYRDKDRYRRHSRIILEHEGRLRRALNSARDNVTMSMSVKCISPIFVNPLHEREVMHQFQLGTQPQLPSKESAYMLFFGVANFKNDEREKDACCAVEARMWGKCPVTNVLMNGKECAPLRPGSFAFFCVPTRDQNQIRLKIDRAMQQDSELMLLSQMVLVQFHAPHRPVAPVNPLSNP